MTATTFTPVEMLDRLVSFDTTSAKSNLALIDWVADYLDGHGIASELTFDAAHTKANLFATLGPAGKGGVILSGHTDVVPVAGQSWASDPFTMTERDGLLYGRGTADMKGFIAIALALAPEWQRRNLRTPMHLALSFDEEVGCCGVRHLIGKLPEGEERPKLVIIGEPTSLDLITAHKGVRIFSTVVTGLDGHSSATHKGVNAIFAAAEIVQFIAGIAAEKKRMADPATPFDPPYSTFNVGMIEGGTANNIIARQCRFNWEIRILPGDDDGAVIRRVQDFIDREVLPKMRDVHPGCSIETEEIIRVPSLAPEQEGKAEALVRHLTGSNRTGTVAFGTEAGLFQEAGLSTVVCGPGSIDQAHKPDEFIALAQMEAGTRLLQKLAHWAQA
jgi:acetylornithine deacetylase